MPADPHDQHRFSGHYRKPVKISVYRPGTTIRYIKYANLTALLRSLVRDIDMHGNYPHLTNVKQVSSHYSDAKNREIERMRERVQPTRVPEEERNVEVVCWLWYVRHEDDHDYHLIVGSARSGPATKFMNIEVSGLPGPRSRDLALLKRARTQLQKLVGFTIPETKYHKLATPIKVRVKGSLFWDGDHYPAGKVGPAAARSNTAWEIHPVTSIEPA